MKLFVWEGPGVLTDYGDGLIVAIGETLQEALAAIEKKESFAMKAFPPLPTREIDLGDNTAPEAWLCWGSS